MLVVIFIWFIFMATMIGLIAWSVKMRFASQKESENALKNALGMNNIFASPVYGQQPQPFVQQPIYGQAYGQQPMYAQPIPTATAQYAPQPMQVFPQNTTSQVPPPPPYSSQKF
jgi:hypothetical protein